MSRFLKQRRRQTPVLFLLSLSMMIGSVGLLTFELVNFTLREDRLPAGISVGGVRVGGMSGSQARSTVEEAYAAPVVLYYQDSPILINPDSVGFRLSIEAMFADAKAASEAGGGFWERFWRYLIGQEETTVRDIVLSADYQSTALRAELEDIARRYDQNGGRTGFDVGTLTTFDGSSGYQLDIEMALPLIDAALSRPDNRVVNLPITQGNSTVATTETLRELLIAYLDSQGFIYNGQTEVASIYVLDLVTGEEVNILGDVAFTAASTAKVGILLNYFRQKVDAPSQEEAFVLANSLLCSNNSSSNFIMKKFQENADIRVGLQEVTDTVQFIGARNSFLTAPFVEIVGQTPISIANPTTTPNPNFDTDPDPWNQTTAEDLGLLFAMLYDCAYNGSGLLTMYTNGEYTPTECQQMLELMSGLQLDRLIEGGIPDGIRISHKNGWSEEVTGNAGIVFPPNGHPYVISIFLWQDTQEGFQNYAVLWPLIEDISRIVWNHFSPQQALLAPRTDLPAAAQECYRRDEAGNISYTYLPPLELIDLNDIDGWKTGR